MRGFVKLVRLLALALVAALVASLPGVVVRGWGTKGHEWIHHRAIDNLSDPLRPLFEKHRAFLAQHSVDPDKRRETDPQEAPKHFIDIDRYGVYPFKDFSLDYDETVRRFGADKVKNNGLVLWTIADYYQRLVGQMKSGDAGWLQTAVDLGHYVADIHQPFHAVENYNGELTGQHGIHFRFESEMVYRNLEKVRFQPMQAFRQEQTPLALSYDVALESFVWVDNILLIERQIVADLKLDRLGLPRDAKNFPIYPDAYYERLWQQTSHIIEKRMNQAASRLANLWYGAWVDAGKPESF